MTVAGVLSLYGKILSVVYYITIHQYLTVWGHLDPSLSDYRRVCAVQTAWSGLPIC